MFGFAETTETVGLRFSAWGRKQKANQFFEDFEMSKNPPLFTCAADWIVCKMREVGLMNDPPKITEYDLGIVNYNRPMESVIRAGEYDWKNNNVTYKNFPRQDFGKYRVTAYLFWYNHSIESKKFLSNVGKRRNQGIVAGGVLDLLVFGEKHPDVQREISVVELRDIWVDSNGERKVVGLWGPFDGRGLYLGSFDAGWGSYCCFLAVRKELAP